MEVKFKSMKEPSEILYVYTDGACQNNGRRNPKAGIGAYCRHFEISDPFVYENPTNQRAELFAILTALEVLRENKLNKKYEEIHIYTDSLYSINCCTKWIHKWIKTKWEKPIKNREFIEPIFDILSTNPQISMFHIKAHTGYQDKHSVGNDMADKLAVKGIE